MPTESVSFMPNVSKPWSTEDLAQKVNCIYTMRCLYVGTRPAGNENAIERNGCTKPGREAFSQFSNCHVLRSGLASRSKISQTRKCSTFVIWPIRELAS